MDSTDGSIILGELRGQHLNMLPAPSLAYIVDVGRRYVEHFPKRNASHAGGSYIQHSLPAQFGLSSVFTFRGMFTAFTSAIRHITGLRAPEQMLWVNTRRVVAAMECTMRFAAAWATSERERDVGSFFTNSGHFKVAVPSLGFRSEPNPTFVRATHIDFRPETMLHRLCNYCYIKNSHSAVLSRGGQGRSCCFNSVRPVLPNVVFPGKEG